MSVSVKCILIYFFRDFSLTINIGLSDMNIKLNDKIAITENIANMLFGLIKLPFVPIIFKNISSSRKEGAPSVFNQSMNTITGYIQKNNRQRVMGIKNKINFLILYFIILYHLDIRAYHCSYINTYD